MKIVLRVFLTTFIVTVFQICLKAQAPCSFTMEQSVSYENCLQTMNVSVIVNGGSGNFQFFWSDGNIDSTYTVTTPVDTVMSCIVYDMDEQCADVIVLDIDIPSEIFGKVTIIGDTLACENADRVLQVLVNGGSGGFLYSWGNGAVTTDYTYTIFPPAPEFITLIVQDTITGCSDNPIIQNLPFIEAPEANFAIQDSLCPGQPIEIINLSDITNCTKFIGYRWFLNGIEKSQSVVPPFNADDAGFTEIKLLILDSLCSDSVTQLIPIYPYNPIQAEVITQEDRYTEIRLGFPDDALIDSCTVYWGDGDSTLAACQLPDDRHYYDEYGRYEIEVSYVNTVGCKIQEALEINVIPEIKVFFPKAFSPDGDGINDTFGPLSDELDKVEATFNVYNRRGQIIFTTSTPEEDWDGKVKGEIAPEGIYHYTYQFKPVNGGENNLGTIKGYFILIK